jgi:hypothetical protein
VGEPLLQREFLLISFGFGFCFISLGDDLGGNLVLLGIVGVDGVVSRVTAVVSGDTDMFPAVDASMTLGGKALFFPAIALSRAQRTAICFPAFLLSLSENLHARIA